MHLFQGHRTSSEPLWHVGLPPLFTQAYIHSLHRFLAHFMICDDYFMISSGFPLVDEVLGELFDMEEVVVEAEEVEERGTPTVRLATEGEGSETGCPSKGEASGGEGTAAGLGGQGLEDGGQDAEGEVRTGAQGLEGGLEGGPVTRKGKSRRRQPKVADATGGQEEPMGKGEENAGGGVSTGGLEGGKVTRKGRSRRRQPKVADVTGGQEEPMGKGPMGKGEENAGGGVSMGGASGTGQASGTVGSDGVYRPTPQEAWDAGRHLRVQWGARHLTRDEKMWMDSLFD